MVERIRFMGYYGSKLQLLWLLERKDVHEFTYKERQQFSKVSFNVVFQVISEVVDAYV